MEDELSRRIELTDGTKGVDLASRSALGIHTDERISPSSRQPSLEKDRASLVNYLNRMHAARISK